MVVPLIIIESSNLLEDETKFTYFYIGYTLVVTTLWIYLMYGPIKEVFIKRVNSKPPTYQRHIYWFISLVFVFIIAGVLLEETKILNEGIIAISMILIFILLTILFVNRMFNYYKKAEYFKRLGFDLSDFKSLLIRYLIFVFTVTILLMFIDMYFPEYETTNFIVYTTLFTVSFVYLIYKIVKLYKNRN